MVGHDDTIDSQLKCFLSVSDALNPFQDQRRIPVISQEGKLRAVHVRFRELD
jgi:hypothetical protein